MAAQKIPQFLKLSWEKKKKKTAGDSLNQTVISFSTRQRVKRHYITEIIHSHRR